MRISYRNNNSGGTYWLSADDYKKLEAKGWDRDGAHEVSKYFESDGVSTPMEIAMDEWEEITGKNSIARGCDCCGPPHVFQEEE